MTTFCDAMATLRPFQLVFVLGCLIAAGAGGCAGQPDSESGGGAASTAALDAAVPLRVVVDGTAIDVTGARVSPGFFTTGPARPLLGRTFMAEEFEPEAAAVAVVHHDFWQEHLAGVPSVIGRRIEIDGRPATVVGIMPDGFDEPSGVRIWLPKPRDGSGG